MMDKLSAAKTTWRNCLFLMLFAIACLQNQRANGDLEIINGRDIRPHGSSPVGQSGTIYRLTITPASESRPAFKHRLMIQPHHTIPGNAITYYLRSMGEHSLDSPWEFAREQFGDECQNWSSIRIKIEDIPIEDMRKAAGFFNTYVENFLRPATRCRDADWGVAVEDLSGKEMISFPLPSAQETRTMARVLMLRSRLAVREGRFDDAVDHFRMTYQLGRNVNEMGFLVSSLIGFAEVGMANEGLLEMIATPDSPNMYWAFAELPSPMISIHSALRKDPFRASRYFPGLKDLETADHPDEKWNEILEEYMREIKEVSAMTRSNHGVMSSIQQNSLASLVSGLAGYTAAKKRLLEGGMDAEKVDSMGVAQVLLIDAARDARFYSHEFEKSFYLPIHKMRDYGTKIEREIHKQAPVRLGARIVDSLSSAVWQVRVAEVRVRAHLNLLMLLESIRNHAATKGELPASLDELDWPVRRNPFTDKAFDYSVEGDTAIVELYQRRSLKDRYEIKIKK